MDEATRDGFREGYHLALATLEDDIRMMNAVARGSATLGGLKVLRRPAAVPAPSAKRPSLDGGRPVKDEIRAIEGLVEAIVAIHGDLEHFTAAEREYATLGALLAGRRSKLATPVLGLAEQLRVYMAYVRNEVLPVLRRAYALAEEHFGVPVAGSAAAAR